MHGVGKAQAHSSHRILWAAGLSSILIIAAYISLINSGYQDTGGVLSHSIFLLIVTIWLVTAYGVIRNSKQINRNKLSKAVEIGTLERERILTIVNNLADAVLSTDANGIVRIYNAASLNLIDTNDSLNGKHIDGVIKLSDEEGTPVSLFEELQKVKSVATRDDLRYNMGDDETMRIEATLSPIRNSFNAETKDASSDGYIIILRDVTKAKSLEEERDEFISVVSHELRTPITIAEGSISNAQLVMQKGEADKKTLQAALDTAHEQVLFLAKMVNDLSTLSRAERGVADEPEDIDLKNLAESLFSEYAPQAAEHNLHLNLDLGTHLGSVKASPLYLRELIQNFITNSIKYTTEGSITLSIHQKDGQANFSVKDTGIGISKTDQAKIFNKFYRAEDYRTRETSGTGLGLYVSAKLARKLGCKIELDSRLNHGSKFSFSLPVSKKK